ncbi:unnamed protein product [Rotaria magnacalcarata]|uniref:polynucleotide adenylyltransferase n=1 Tax=Rotaria magnacalcarata TaxID=392030 RepID=A0A8S2K9L2_9BILA|nr:unnamed protein product [Rotaria magnacalcarata]
MTESNSEIALTEQLNLIRSILQSEELLQIQSSGDYDQVRIKLDHDIQITFFFDSLSMFNKPLTIETVHDLRLTKSSSKCLLTNEQWITIRQYFDELIQQSDNTTLIQSIVQSIQDHLLQILASNKTTKQKGKKPPKTTTSDKDSSSTTNRFRGGELIFNRILHDKTIDRSKVIIGYEDRFTGIHEIAFNEFKKVHEHEYGVPMHRLRHFKINGEVVWDRTNKIDILTGNKNITNSHNLIKDDLHLAQGLFYFDQSTQQWIQYPHIPIISDDQKNPSTIETCLPSRCHFVTWNILVDYHHSQLIYTSQRYQSILDKLKSLLPDVICLQEVTKTFINLLLNQIWLQENHYYIVFMEKALDSEQTKSYGQLLLTKNFRPRSFSICPLDTTEKAADVTKQIIIARFGLNPKITIDLVNLHLNSNGSRNAERKRCQTLEHLLQNLKTNNFMLIGDFNFGDFDLKENDLLDKYQEEVHDLWKQIYNIDELNSIDLKLKEFFQTMNLYESDESYNQKQDKFTKLSSCFQQIFNEQNSHHFRHSFVPYGSFRIGINGEDLDTVFVLNEVKSNEGETELDKTLIQMQHDKSSLNNHILNLLETQIKVNFENEIVYCRKVQALFSIISILFTDLTKVDVSLQIKLNEKQSLESSKEPTLGVHEIEHLLIHARSPPIFQHLLTFIRKWAQNFGIYGQVYGYLGGYSWAILCAHICHSFLTPIESLYTIEQFSVDQLFSLVQSFFSTYSKFNWSTQTLTLVPRLSKSMNNSSTVLQRGSMRILSPTPPHNNSARATIASTRDLIVQYFQRIENLLETINTISSEDKFNALKRILELKHIS